MTPAPQISPSGRNALLAVILLGTLLGPLDSAVNIAFPDITSSFAIELQAIRWVIVAYVATYASLMLVFGRIGDLYGHNRVFIGGLAVCIAGFAICSLARDFNWLLLARIMQGIGTAMVLSCGPALATGLFEEHLRPRILGLYAMIFGLGGAVGPSIGGLLVDLWGWPAVFWFRIPLAVAALALFVVLQPPASQRAVGRFDLAVSSLLAGTTALLLLTVTQWDRAATQPVLILGLFLSTVAAAAAFVRLSRRSPVPIIELGWFGDFRFAWINVANVIVNLAGFATMLFVPYFLVQVSALPVWQSGLIMAAGPVMMMAASSLGGRAIAAAGAGRLALAGAILVACGLYWIGNWEAATHRVTMVLALAVHGAGLGLFQVTSLDIVAASLPRSNRGVAGSLALVMRTIGVVLAACLLTLMFAHYQHVFADRGTGQAFVLAFQVVFQMAAVGLFAFALMSMLRPRLWADTSS